MLDISLIGTGGMIPLDNRFLTAMLARYNGSMLLIDCGEGTQVTMRKLGWGFVNLDYICFTHFHADHIAGLPGLLLSLSNYGRTKPITIVGPKGIKNVVNSLRVIAPELFYEIKFIEISFEDSSSKDFKLGDFHISALPLNHAINCIGYSLRIKRSGKFDTKKAKELQIPVNLWSKLQKGETIEHDGKIYTSNMILGEERKGIKVSYITDTRPIDTIPSFILGSDLFICEGIYGDDEMKSKAHRFYHMVFSEAAELAKLGNVKELWLTHYSQAFTNPEEYINISTNIFPNSKTGYDRISKTFVFED